MRLRFPILLFVFLAIFSVQTIAASTAPRSAGGRVMALIEKISDTLTTSRYQHRTVVRKSRGEYFFDCSGMAQWILKRTAPRALQAVAGEDRRPLARDFFHTLNRIAPGKTRGPWMRLKRLEDARPGDVLAWIRPKWFPSKSTGHVAFVVDQPVKNSGPVPGLLFRIADASKFRHENDSRQEGETGFGTGTLLVPTDASGEALGYGWIGSLTPEEYVVPTDLAIGRPLR